MYIDPAECIDCGACEPACPVEAIYPEDEVPSEYEGAIAINRDFFATSTDGQNALDPAQLNFRAG
jgi:ferredoxin